MARGQAAATFAERIVVGIAGKLELTERLSRPRAPSRTVTRCMTCDGMAPPRAGAPYDWRSKPRNLAAHGSESMSDNADERRIEPPMVVESFGDLDGKSRSAIRRAAAGAHVEALANRARELCAVFDELDADGLSDDAQEKLWRAHDLMEEACSALDDVGRDGEDGR